jgi:hypothetical protein
MTKIKTILFCWLCSFLSCNSHNSTPENYKYHTIVSSKRYGHDQNTLRDSIEVLIKENQEPFHPHEDDSLTNVFIDTILYSPKNDKYATFIITKNSDEKLPDKGKRNEFHYNAFCFIGKLNADSTIKDLTWISAHIVVRYKSLQAVSSRIRQIYFNEIATRKNLAAESTFKFNFDDIRFWDGPLWQKYYQ